MSRAKLRDNSNTVSLFPFLAVLLCTMGSLLVVLVVVVTVSREHVQEHVAAEQSRAVDNASDQMRATRFDEVGNYVGKLNQIEAVAKQKLRDDQLRLRHIEDHMRRLQDQLDDLRMAAAELDALEEEHYDDRAQAEQEVERLHELIAESREELEELRQEAQGKSRSYAIVPYEGRNGTRRRPIYVECRKNAVILQPEGIELTPADFHPPLGAGNPLASALRAARQQMIEEDPSLGGSADSEPYPLILVRPDGVAAYYRVREAIQSWDSDFGYELVDGDWELAFPPSNPELARVEYQAVLQARIRQRMLAAAAPRAYSHTAGGSDFTTFEVANQPAEPASGIGSLAAAQDSANASMSQDGVMTGSTESGGKLTKSEYGTSAGSRSPVPPGQPRLDWHADEPVDADEYASLDPPASFGVGSERAASAHGLNRSDVAPQAGAARIAQDQEIAQRNDSAQTRKPSDLLADPEVGLDRAPQASTTQSGRSSASINPNLSSSGMNAPDVSAAGVSSGPTTIEHATATGLADIGLSGVGGPRNGVPIRRTVHVVVRGDRFSILPDRFPASDPEQLLAGGHQIAIGDDPDQTFAQFTSALQQHIQQWGIAGAGLYWRPVLMLNVAPDGTGHARQLANLLHRSGIEVRDNITATHPGSPTSNAKR